MKSSKIETISFVVVVVALFILPHSTYLRAPQTPSWIFGEGGKGREEGMLQSTALRESIA